MKLSNILIKRICHHFLLKIAFVKILKSPSPRSTWAQQRTHQNTNKRENTPKASFCGGRSKKLKYIVQILFFFPWPPPLFHFCFFSCSSHHTIVVVFNQKPGLEKCDRVQGLGFRVQGLRFRVQGSGFRVYGLMFKGLGLRFKVLYKIAHTILYDIIFEILYNDHDH